MALEPIVLNPDEFIKKETLQTSSSWRRNIGLMLTGWVAGNLVIGGLLAIAVITTVASTGLVKVPILTNQMFAKVSSQEIDSSALRSANAKLSKISSLQSDQTLSELSFTDAELSALLTDSFEKKGVSILNPAVKLESGKFVLTGYLEKTAAPVRVEGSINSNAGLVSLSLTKTSFGKLSLPTSLGSLFLNNDLAKTGFSLTGNPIPAEQISIENGKAVLDLVSGSSE